MSDNVNIDGYVFSIDEIYESFDEGNKQHMANKLYKYGWYPTKLLTESWIEGCRADEFDAYMTKKRTKTIQAIPGKRYRIASEDSGWTGVTYMATTQQCSDGTPMLFNLDTGTRFSSETSFGTRKVVFEEVKGG